MSHLRFRVVEEAFKRKAVEVPLLKERPSEYFGKYVFNKEKMRRYLSKQTYEALVSTMENGSPLQREI
ncbi:MAG: glutamine synthetase III, partial [Bacteroidales bacterium]